MTVGAVIFCPAVGISAVINKATAACVAKVPNLSAIEPFFALQWKRALPMCVSCRNQFQSRKVAPWYKYQQNNELKHTCETVYTFSVQTASSVRFL